MAVYAPPKYDGELRWPADDPTGTVVGIIGAVAVTRLLATLLYGTSPTEISTFAGVSVVFLAVAAVACLIPARAVTAIDPVIALRQD